MPGRIQHVPGTAGLSQAQPCRLLGLSQLGHCFGGLCRDVLGTPGPFTMPICIAIYRCELGSKIMLYYLKSGIFVRACTVQYDRLHVMSKFFFSDFIYDLASIKDVEIGKFRGYSYLVWGSWSSNIVAIECSFNPCIFCACLILLELQDVEFKVWIGIIDNYTAHPPVKNGKDRLFGGWCSSLYLFFYSFPMWVGGAMKLEILKTTPITGEGEKAKSK